MKEIKFVCKCGQMAMWLSEGQRTEACPKCGREYIGRKNFSNVEVVGEEVHPRNWFPVDSVLNEDENV